MIHVVNKGKDGEREVVKLLNDCLRVVCADLNLCAADSQKIMELAQRNQNQSAVGGADINILGLSIEVKRQETLSLDKWWKQATTSASRLDNRAVLIYRQNRKPWNVVIDGYIPTFVDSQAIWAPCHIDLSTFKQWFTCYATLKIERGELD